MLNNTLTKEIVTCKSKMRQLTKEFMKAKDITTADEKLNALTDLAQHVANLKEERRNNSVFTKFKKKLGL